MRAIPAALAVIVMIVSLNLAHETLSVLDFASNASAPQITQVHSEADTIIFGGMLIVMALLVVAVAMPASIPAPRREPVQDSPAARSTE